MENHISKTQPAFILLIFTVAWLTVFLQKIVFMRADVVFNYSRCFTLLLKFP